MDGLSLLPCDQRWSPVIRMVRHCLIREYEEVHVWVCGAGQYLRYTRSTRSTKKWAILVRSSSGITRASYILEAVVVQTLRIVLNDNDGDDGD